MSVVDASVVVDALVVHGPTGTAARHILRHHPRLLAPHILKAEAASALRRMEQQQAVTPHRAHWALDALRRLPLQAYPVDPFLDRIWELRGTLTVYDAWYVALAERLGTTLFTVDRRLAQSPGPACDVQTVGGQDHVEQ